MGAARRPSPLQQGCCSEEDLVSVQHLQEGHVLAPLFCLRCCLHGLRIAGLWPC